MMLDPDASLASCAARDVIGDVPPKTPYREMTLRNCRRHRQGLEEPYNIVDVWSVRRIEKTAGHIGMSDLVYSAYASRDFGRCRAWVTAALR